MNVFETPVHALRRDAIGVAIREKCTILERFRHKSPTAADSLPGGGDCRITTISSVRSNTKSQADDRLS